MKRAWFLFVTLCASVLFPLCTMNMVHAETMDHASMYPSDMACCPVSVHVDTPDLAIPVCTPDVAVVVPHVFVPTPNVRPSQVPRIVHVYQTKPFFERSVMQRE